MPAPLIAQSTVTLPPGALPARVMVNTAVWPSARAAWSTAMEKRGAPAPLAAMVVAALAVAMAAPPVGLLKVTVRVSALSTAESSVMAKMRVCSPRAAKDKVPPLPEPAPETV